MRRVLRNACFLAALAPIASAADGDKLDLHDYTPAFVEEFDALDVSPWGTSPSRWIAHTPWAGDFGDARFADPRPGFPFVVENGVLRIEARKNDDGKWESGLLSLVNPKGQGFAQEGGYFEARMKFPCGAGVWPAFWLIGVDRSQYTAEIDVVEYYGHEEGRYHTNYHVWRKQKGAKDLGLGNVVQAGASGLCGVFHDYGVDVGEMELIYYLDGVEVWRTPTPKEFFGVKFYPLVNLALGSGWPIDKTPNPSYLWVDGIKIYKRIEH